MAAMNIDSRALHVLKLYSRWPVCIHSQTAITTMYALCSAQNNGKPLLLQDVRQRNYSVAWMPKNVLTECGMMVCLLSCMVKFLSFTGDFSCNGIEIQMLLLGEWEDKQ